MLEVSVNYEDICPLTQGKSQQLQWATQTCACRITDTSPHHPHIIHQWTRPRKMDRIQSLCHWSCPSPGPDPFTCSPVAALPCPVHPLFTAACLCVACCSNLQGLAPILCAHAGGMARPSATVTNWHSQRACFTADCESMRFWSAHSVGTEIGLGHKFQLN